MILSCFDLDYRFYRKFRGKLVSILSVICLADLQISFTSVWHVYLSSEGRRHSFIGPLNDDWRCTGHGTHGRWHTPGLGVDRLAEGSPHETSITKQSMRREVGMDRGLWRMYPRSTAELQAGAPKPF